MASRYLTLKQEKHDLMVEWRALEQRARDQGRTATDAEARRIAEIDAQLVRLDAEILDEEKRMEAVRTAPAAADANVLADRGQLPMARTATSPRYSAMFGPPGYDADFASFDHFAKDLHLGLSSPGLLKAAAMTTGDVGYLLPPQYAAQLFDQALEDEIVRPRARPEPMMSDSKSIAGFTADDDSVGPFGITGGWTAEAATIGTQKPTIRAIQLHAKKLAALAQLSNEALADGADVGTQLSQALTRALSWHLDLAFLAGTGAGMPLGVLNAPCTVVVSPEGGQAAATITYTNLVKMFARLLPGSVRNAVWAANVSAIPQLLSLTIAVGTGGSAVPVLSESNGEFRLLSRPVLFTEKLPALGQQGDILLADFSYYAVGMRAELVIERSPHLGFDSDTTWYRAKLRADGQPLLDKPFTPKNGSTLSPFVVLGPRP